MGHPHHPRLLIILDSLGGRTQQLLSMLSGTMQLPGPALVIATLLFPALLGWSGAALAAELGNLPIFTRAR
jgi:hypothetical protein